MNKEIKIEDFIKIRFYSGMVCLNVLNKKYSIGKNDIVWSRVVQTCMPCPALAFDPGTGETQLNRLRI